MANNPLTLDLQQLAQRFFDLQQGTPEAPGWTDKNNQALYFVAAGSEYRLWMPKCGHTEATLQPATVTAYGKVLAEMERWVNENTTGSQQADDLARIAAAQSELASNGTYPMMFINTTVDHIRGGGQDDHAAVQLTVFWSEALGVWLPDETQLGFSWGTSTVAVPQNAIQKLGLPWYDVIPTRFLLSRIPGVKRVVQLVTIIQLAARLWNLAVKIVSMVTDDGGRLYFPTVVCETVSRILLSITPAFDPTATTMITPDLMKLGRQWVAEYPMSLYKGIYRTFASGITAVINPTDQTLGTYYVSLPDLVYLPGGAGTMLSFKMTAGDNAAYASATLLFDRDGSLMMVSGMVQFNTGSVYSSPPVWANDNSTPASMISQVIRTLFRDNVPVISTNTTAELQYEMPNVLNAYLGDLVADVRSISASSQALLSALPPLPTIIASSATSIATGAKRPAVAVVSSGYGVVLRVDGSGEDALWETTISTSSSGLSVSSSQTKSYQGGQDPAVVAYNDSTLVEVHGGNGNNSLYDNVFTISGSSVTVPSSGDKYDKGENPAIAVSGSTLYEFHRDQSSGSDQLYYEIGTLSNGKIKFSGSGTKYAEGDNVFACACPGHSELVVAYSRGGTLYTRNSSVSSSSVDLGTEATLGDGDGPAVAVLSNNFVLVFHQGTDNASNMLCVSIGLWSSSSIQWIVTGVHLGIGQYPGVSRRTDDTVVVVYETDDGKGGIAGQVMSLSLPTGFV